MRVADLEAVAVGNQELVTHAEVTRSSKVEMGEPIVVSCKFRDLGVTAVLGCC